jgi:DNA sulfur modification protein DndC
MMSKGRQISLWESDRMGMADAIETSIASLIAYGAQYKHWSIAYSGGKDSTTTVSFILWAIEQGRIQRPETLTVLYADTRQELPPLQRTAMRFIADLQAEGVDARIVLPEIDNRFYVYLLGRGVPPPSNTFRWCTERLKIKPMLDALHTMHVEHGQRFLQITGVRLGESAVRDQRIAISCTSTKGECGQGWFQQMGSEAISDTLAPIVHWRTCFVWDWLYDWYSDNWAQACGYEQGHKREYLGDLAAAYGDDDARTGCIGCNLASRDVALENIIHTPEWEHLRPLLGIKPLFAELKKPRNRIRKASPEFTKSGEYAKKGQRMGPLTMEGRAYGLERVLDIQRQAGVDLINAEEESRIRELWELNTYPEGWEGGLENPNHLIASQIIDSIQVVGSELVVQPILL